MVKCSLLKFSKTTLWKKTGANQYCYWSSCLIIFIDYYFGVCNKQTWTMNRMSQMQKENTKTRTYPLVCLDLRFLLCPSWHPGPHQDASRPHQCHRPRGLQCVEGPLPVPDRLPFLGSAGRPRHHPTGGTRWAESQDAALQLMHIMVNLDEFWFCVFLCSSSERTLAAAGAADHPDGLTRPVLAVLAAGPRLRLPVALQHSALHAGVPGHVLCALHPRQHLPGI